MDPQMDHGLHLSSVCNVNVTKTDPKQRVVVKVEDIKEETDDYMIGCYEEEKPTAEQLSCKIEADVAEDVGYEEKPTTCLLQTTAWIEVELEDDEEELDHLLGVPEPSRRTQQKFHGQNEELDLQEPTGSLQHHCTVCRKSFTDQTQLETHQQEEHNHTLGGVHQNQDSDKRSYNITQCGEYKVIHVGGKMYKCVECPLCGELLAHKSALKIHMFKHTGEMPYECDHCGKGCTTRGDLNVHMSIHTGETPHKCAVCGVVFPFKSSLKAHMFKHTGEKPHKCTQCGRGFSSQGGLKYHVATHTGQTPYKCDHCEEEFKFISSLKKHALKHKRESEASVDNHMFNHAGENLHSDLVNHDLTLHTVKKVYKCQDCEMEYKSSSGLKRHTEHKHPGRGIVTSSHVKDQSLAVSPSQGNVLDQASHVSVVSLNTAKDCSKVTEMPKILNVQLIPILRVNPQTGRFFIAGSVAKLI